MAKEKEMFYYKLGPNGGVFYDPSTQIQISGNLEVIALEKEPKSKSFVMAVRGGHVVRASKDEFIKWDTYKGVPQENTAGDDDDDDKKSEDDLLKEELEGKTIEEILQWAETFGFDEEDMKKAKKKETKEKLITYVMKQKASYK